jgi:glutathionylspermidine synthase
MSFFILYEKEFRDLFYSVIKNIRKEFSPWPCSVILYTGCSIFWVIAAAAAGLPIRADKSVV